MLLVGVTGGIGSGKSTVAAMLERRGAVVVDADRIARDLVGPGAPLLEDVVRTFGADVVGTSGELDRAALAARVFSDPDALARLESITHPAIAAEVRTRVARLAGDPSVPPDRIVVLDHPLLVERGSPVPLHALVVVLADADRRAERLERVRGMDAADVRARMAVQSDDVARRAVASDVILNDGSLVDLEREVAALHARLIARAGRDERGEDGSPPAPTGPPSEDQG